MGDRAIVVFKAGDDVAPAIYLHWHGTEVSKWLKEAAPLLRKGDASYAAARFCGFCHTKIKGVTGLGLLDAPSPKDMANLDGYSHGDAGVIVVDIETGEVKTAGGYAKPFQLDVTKLGT